MLAARQLRFELIVRCKIDHRDPLAIPEFLCGACHPELNDPAPARATAPRAEAKTDWLFDVRPNNCTARDIAVMRELSDSCALAQQTKTANRIVKMKKRLESRSIPKGARWDLRRARWVTP